MCQILKFRQVGKFQVERINDKPTVNRYRNDHNPEHCHHNVVEEYQVVNDGKEEKCKKSKADENSKAP